VTWVQSGEPAKAVEEAEALADDKNLKGVDRYDLACVFALVSAAIRMTLPSWMVTVPVGRTVVGSTGLTVAGNVTGWPKNEGLADEVNVVLVSALVTVWELTVCVKATEVLGVKFGLPLSVAVRVWLPAPSVEVVTVAWPDVLRLTGVWAVPSIVKVTVPVGVPAPGETALTVAVKVTGGPTTDGLTDEVMRVASAQHHARQRSYQRRRPIGERTEVA
jgi:hypothetical protein